VYDNGLAVGAQSAGDLDVLIGMGPGTIQGTLLDPSQKPLPSTLVFLVPATNRRNNMALYKTASSDANGKFSIGGIVPGQYELYAWQNVIQGAYQNAEYLRKYQGRGTVVSVMQAATVMAQVHVIPAEQR
jgi:hypothetical protein